MANLNEPQFEPRRHQGFAALRARPGSEAGSERIGLSLWELPPGEAAYPYHWHLVEEELVIVLAGTPMLRTPEGRRRLENGEVVSFPAGEEGAHELWNDGDETVRFLSFSSSRNDPEICFYPDSGKVGVFAEGIYEVYRRESQVDYWAGEEPPTAAGSSSA